MKPIDFVKNETELHKLLEKEPERIEKGMRMVASKKKLKKILLISLLRKHIQPSGEIDLLLKDKDGCPVIVEIKGDTNVTERRRGVYQLVEYSFYFSDTWVTPRLIYITLKSIRLWDPLLKFDIEPMFWEDIGIGRKNKDGKYPVYPIGTKLQIPKIFYYHREQEEYKKLREMSKQRVKRKNEEIMKKYGYSYKDFWKEVLSL